MIIIPDIHGRDFWKEAVKGRESEKIIFLGDYVDPYPAEGIAPEKGMQTLIEVIEFKKKHMENVVLLLGNHDLSYVSNYLPKCRHDYVNHHIICSLLKENMPLFDIVHEAYVSDIRILFSHAGILPDWLDDNVNIIGKIEPGDEARHLNHMFHDDHIYAALGDVSPFRGGHVKHGSCVWADIDEFIGIGNYIPGWNQIVPHDEPFPIPNNPSMLPDCFQVFGHTQLKAPIITDWFAGLDCHKAFTLDDAFVFTPIEPTATQS